MVDFCLLHVIHIWKAMTLSYHFSASYMPSDFCWQTILYFLEHLRMSQIHIMVEFEKKQLLKQAYISDTVIDGTLV